MPAASTVAQLQVVIDADTSAAEKGLADLGTKVGNAGSALQTAFAGAAVAGIAGVAAGLAASVSAAADFESTMSGVKAVSGATAEEMSGLSGLALQLGKDTSFSAAEAGKGIEELVKGGLTIPDIMNGAAQATLDLAAAGGVSLPDAATIAANALAEFNLKGSDMAHVADLIAGAANASALDVSDFKFSLSAAGAVAATVGFSFDDLAQGIAVMGKAGITGADAGTSLKTMMMNLVPATNKAGDMMRDLGIITGETGPVMDKLKTSLAQTELGQKKLAELTKSGLITSEEELFKALDKVNPALAMGASNATDYGVKAGLLGNQFFDASGKVKSMSDVAEILKVSLADMSQEQQLATLRTLFGSDAIRAAAVLAKEGAAGFTEMADSMGKVTAQAVGAEKLNNLNGSVEQLKGSLETMGIMIGLQLLPILKDFVDALTQAANDAMPAMEQAAKDVAATLQAWMPTLKAVAGFLWEHRDAVVAVVTALATFVILTTVIGWITTVVTAISGLIAIISGAGGVMAALGGLVAILGGPVTLIIAAIALAVGVLALAWSQNWGDIQGKTQAVVDFLSGVPDMVSGFFQDIADAQQGLQWAMDDTWANIREGTLTLWDWVSDFLSTWWREILIALTGPVGALAVLIIDNWQTIADTTATIFEAIKNVLIAVWDLIYTEVIQPKLELIGTFISTTWDAITTATEEKVGLVRTFLETTWDAISTAIGEKIALVQTTLSAAWDAIKLAAEAVMNPFLTWWRDAVWEPVKAAVTERIAFIQTTLSSAWDAIKTAAEAVLNPFVTWWRDTIWGPISTAVGEKMDAAKTAFQSALDGFKSAVDSTMGSVKTAWETMWAAIQHAAESPKAALDEVTKAVEALVKVMPSWLIPHSPTPFEMGIRGIADAVKTMQGRMASFTAGMGDVPGELADWIDAAIKATGASQAWASGLAWIAMHESSGKPHAVNPEAVGNEHASGIMQTLPSTFAAYAEGGMKDIFNPVHNIAAAINYINAAYVKRGRSLDWIIEHWAERGGYAGGGWAGLHGPELAWLGERGPEYVVPNAALRGGGSAAPLQSVTMPIVIGNRVIEELWITGRDLAIRRGRVPGAGAASMGGIS